MPSDVFVQLVDAHYTALYRFALSLARREADACDLVQQTFFIWAKRGHQLREDTKAKTWLFTTLYREFLRGRRRDQRVQSIEELPAGADDVAAEEIDHARRLDGSQIVEALQQVDEVYRAPLVLFYLQDMSYHEIAESLDVPIGTVMSRLSRGKIQLRRLLANKETAASRLGTVVEFPDLKKGTAGK
ncbi:MAG TPA: RNA polymerase sigma factor [Opitutaceae bacterium]|nr:RNA polymerase sigma factor [Opitutaceae bacterium]